MTRNPPQSQIIVGSSAPGLTAPEAENPAGASDAIEHLNDVVLSRGAGAPPITQELAIGQVDYDGVETVYIDPDAQRYTEAQQRFMSSTLSGVAASQLPNYIAVQGYQDAIVTPYGPLVPSTVAPAPPRQALVDASIMPSSSSSQAFARRVSTGPQAASGSVRPTVSAFSRSHPRPWGDVPTDGFFQV